MPPRLKRHRSFTPLKPGKLVQHVIDNYSSLPAVSSDFLKGHILYVYVTSGNRSRTKTRNELFTHIPSTVQDTPHKKLIFCYLHAGIKRIVSETLKKFTKLSDPNEFQKFCRICQESFLLNPDIQDDSSPSMDTQHDVDNAVGVPSTSTTEPVLPNTPVKTRQIAKCVNCKRLRKGLRTLRQKQLEMQREKTVAIKNFMAKQKKKSAVKTLNQTIKRKDAQLISLRKKMSSVVGDDLEKLRGKTWSLNKRHSALKSYYRQKKSKHSSPSDISFEEEIEEFKDKCKEKDKEIVALQIEKTLLEEKVDEYENAMKSTKADGKEYNMDMRMMVFDAISDQVPTANIPHLILKFAKRCGFTLSDIPHRTTVERMTRELGAISDLQTAEVILTNENTTLGFDATTQEGDHINSIHVTTKEDCYVVAIDELPGGTAVDYSTHIIDSIHNLAAVHTFFTGEETKDVEKRMIKNIANTMTDRCAANHAAVGLVEEKWGKELNELNCHLHPLDSIATKSRTALKKCEGDGQEKGLWGKDCIAGNIVLSFNKIRYKDGKGDPRGFKTFLNNANLPLGLLPRYRGNRLHILFHICGVLVEHYLRFMEFLRKGTSCGGLRNSLLKDFNSVTGHVQMQVLGVIGKFLSGPWMKKFYCSASDQIDHVEGIAVIKQVVERLNAEADPLDMLQSTTDFFGEPLEDSHTLTALRKAPKDPEQFRKMMKAVIGAVLEVLERQYRKYFDTEVTEKLKEETKSARSHNIDAEEVMGMFSAAKKRAPNATLCFLSSKMRAQKNRTAAYLDALPMEKREDIVKKATKLGFEQRNKGRLKHKELEVELSKRQAAKQQTRETTDRNRLEKKLKTISPEQLAENFEELSEEKLGGVTDLLEGQCVGYSICHVWYEDGQAVTYNGKIEKLKSKGKKYVVAYWNSNNNETYEEDGTDYDMSIYALAADLIGDDLMLN